MNGMLTAQSGIAPELAAVATYVPTAQLPARDQH